MTTPMNAATEIRIAAAHREMQRRQREQQQQQQEQQQQQGNEDASYGWRRPQYGTEDRYRPAPGEERQFEQAQQMYREGSIRSIQVDEGAGENGVIKKPVQFQPVQTLAEEERNGGGGSGEMTQSQSQAQSQTQTQTQTDPNNANEAEPQGLREEGQSYVDEDGIERMEHPHLQSEDLQQIQPMNETAVRRIVSGQAITDLASIVKELVDNSLDANARTINIRLYTSAASIGGPGGGRPLAGIDLVEVSDDGDGIPPSSRPYVAVRHATSKLRRFSDLYSNTTTNPPQVQEQNNSLNQPLMGQQLGFRGEALYSLASTCQSLVLATRCADEPYGQQLVFQHDGSLYNPEDIQALSRKVGTTVAVMKPFGQLPVRRIDFVKRIKSQRAAMFRLLQSYAIFNVGVQYSVTDMVEGGGGGSDYSSDVKLVTTLHSRTIEDTVCSVLGSPFLMGLVRIKAVSLDGVFRKKGRRRRGGEGVVRKKRKVDDQGHTDKDAELPNGKDEHADKENEARQGTDTPKETAKSQDKDTSNEDTNKNQDEGKPQTELQQEEQQQEEDEESDEEPQETKWKIEGLIARAPGSTMVGAGQNIPPARQLQFFCLNQRPVEMPALTKVINDAWKRTVDSSASSVSKKKRPACILNVTLPPGAYDVNVRPDKREVLLTKEEEVCNALHEALVELWGGERRGGMFASNEVERMSQQQKSSNGGGGGGGGGASATVSPQDGAPAGRRRIVRRGNMASGMTSFHAQPSLSPSGAATHQGVVSTPANGTTGAEANGATASGGQTSLVSEESANSKKKKLSKRERRRRKRRIAKRRLRKRRMTLDLSGKRRMRRRNAFVNDPQNVGRTNAEGHEDDEIFDDDDDEDDEDEDDDEEDDDHGEHHDDDDDDDSDGSDFDSDEDSEEDGYDENGAYGDDERGLSDDTEETGQRAPSSSSSAPEEKKATESLSISARSTCVESPNGNLDTLIAAVGNGVIGPEIPEDDDLRQGESKARSNVGLRRRTVEGTRGGNVTSSSLTKQQRNLSKTQAPMMSFLKQFALGAKSTPDIPSVKVAQLQSTKSNTKGGSNQKYDGKQRLDFDLDAQGDDNFMKGRGSVPKKSKKKQATTYRSRVDSNEVPEAQVTSPEEVGVSCLSAENEDGAEEVLEQRRTRKRIRPKPTVSDKSKTDSEKPEMDEKPKDNESGVAPVVWSSFNGVDGIMKQYVNARRKSRSNYEFLRLTQKSKQDKRFGGSRIGARLSQKGKRLSSLEIEKITIQDKEGGSGDSEESGAEKSKSKVVTLKKEDFLSMDVIGQFNLGFILAKTCGGQQLFILDQHACDEKFNFERLCKTTVLHEQRLIAPLPLELSPSEENCILDNMDVFNRNGFRFKYDEKKPPRERLALTALPHSGSGGDGRKAVQFGKEDVSSLCSILGAEGGSSSSHINSAGYGTGADGNGSSGNNAVRRYAGRGNLSQSQKNEKVTAGGSGDVTDPGGAFSQPDLIRLPKVVAMLASRACRHSIMIGTPLSAKEMNTVIQKMYDVDQPWDCPHGRPTMRHVTGLLDELLEDELATAQYIARPTMAVLSQGTGFNDEHDGTGTAMSLQ